MKSVNSCEKTAIYCQALTLKSTNERWIHSSETLLRMIHQKCHSNSIYFLDFYIIFQVSSTPQTRHRFVEFIPALLNANIYTVCVYTHTQNENKLFSLVFQLFLPHWWFLLCQAS